MKLKSETQGPVAVLAVSGDLTVDDVEKFRRHIQDHLDDQARDFVLDLGQIEFIDSQGIEALLWLQDKCGEELGQMRLTGLSQYLCTILEITRLTSRFDCHDTVESAVKSL